MHPKKHLLALVISAVLVFAMAGAVWAIGTDFVDYDSNPVIDPANAAYYPDVLYSPTGFDGHGANSPYKMWYDDGANTWLSYSDDGFNWTNLDTPVIVGLRHPQVQYSASAFGDSAGDPIQAAFPETYSVTPYYKMWTWNNENNANGKIRFAYSADGVTWHTNYPRDLVPSSILSGSSVVYDLEVLFENGTYYGYADNNGNIYNCTSSDGTTWTGGAQAIPKGAGGEWDSSTFSRAAVVRVTDTEWHMWFGGSTSGGGNQGIGHATSSDGTNWTKDSPNVPIQSLGGYGPFGGLGDTGTWNAARNYAISVIYDANSFSGNGEAAQLKMWRSGKDMESGGNYAIGVTGIEPVPVPEPDTTTYYSIEGSNRFQTAIEASRESFPNGADTVILATSRNWPDAMGGSALAGAYECPILLVDTNSISPEVAEEIKRLGAKEAFVLGGPVAISEDVATELAKSLTVNRLGGVDRYETAELIAAAVVKKLGSTYDGTAFAATGANFPDALAASPVACAKGWPIYLVSPSLGAPTEAMQDNEVADVLTLGGTAAVSATHQKALVDAFGGAKVKRLAGDTRYATAVEIATYGVDDAGLSWDWTAIATGENFPDALSGGVVPARKRSVMLLTKTATLPYVVKTALGANREDIANVYYLGGPEAVSLAVRAEVAGQLR